MPGLLDMQLEQLRERFGEVQTRQLPSGTTLVTVPGVRLPEGWSKSSTTIRFIVPPGYPFAQLDCFWRIPISFLRMELHHRTPHQLPSRRPSSQHCGSRGI